MQYSRNGSMTLLVVLVMGLLMILCVGMWHTTSLLVDIAIKRQEAALLESVLDAVLDFGNDVGSCYFAQLSDYCTQKHEPIRIAFSSLLEPMRLYTHLYVELTIISHLENQLQLEARVFDRNGFSKRKVSLLSKVVSDQGRVMFVKDSAQVQ